jgi:peroxiredoxin Q/BCP
MNIGDKVQAFKLTDEAGNTITEKSFLGKWTVLFFYPKDSTPGCTTEACSFRDNIDAFKKINTQVYGASKDSAKSHNNFIAKQSLNFPLIVDTEGILLEQFSVWQLKKLYGREYMGIVRSSFIINPDGYIAKIYPKVKVKEHVAEVLADLIELQK